MNLRYRLDELLAPFLAAFHANRYAPHESSENTVGRKLTEKCCNDIPIILDDTEKLCNPSLTPQTGQYFETMNLSLQLVRIRTETCFQNPFLFEESYEVVVLLTFS